MNTHRVRIRTYADIHTPAGNNFTWSPALAAAMGNPIVDARYNTLTNWWDVHTEHGIAFSVRGKKSVFVQVPMTTSVPNQDHNPIQDSVYG